MAEEGGLSRSEKKDLKSNANIFAKKRLEYVRGICIHIPAARREQGECNEEYKDLAIDSRHF